MNGKLVLGLGLCTALWLATGTAHAWSTRDLMSLMAGVNESETSFVETRHSSLLKAPLVLTGRLVYRRPSRLEKHVQSPYAESTVIEGSQVSVTRGNGQPSRTVTVPAGAAQALVESLRATLAGDLPALERHFTVSVTGEQGAWALTLLPRDAALSDFVKRVEITGADAKLGRIEMLEGSGDRTVTVMGAK